MHDSLLRLTALTLFVGICGLVPAHPVAAQDDGDRADALSTDAHRIASDMTRWAEAAQMHEESGLLRMRGDTRAYLSFSHAARLYYYADDLRASEKMFESAGDNALDVGDVYNAAISYLNAAAVAEQNGREREAQKLGWKAERLSRSQLLNDEQRNHLTRRYQVLSGAGR